jgi:hypothetical protein
MIKTRPPRSGKHRHTDISGQPPTNVPNATLRKGAECLPLDAPPILADDLIATFDPDAVQTARQRP